MFKKLSISAIALCLCFAVSAQTAKHNFGKKQVTEAPALKPIQGEFKTLGFIIRLDLKTVEPYSVCPIQKTFILQYRREDCENTYGKDKMSTKIILDNSSILTVWLEYADPSVIVGYKYVDMTDGGKVTEEGDTSL